MLKGIQRLAVVVAIGAGLFAACQEKEPAVEEARKEVREAAQAQDKARETVVRETNDVRRAAGEAREEAREKIEAVAREGRQEVRKAVDKAAEETREARIAIEALAADRATWSRQTGDLMKDYDLRITALGGRARKLEGEQREALDRDIRALQERYVIVLTEMGKVRALPEQEFPAARDRVNQSLNDLEKAYEETEDRLD